MVNQLIQKANLGNLVIIFGLIASFAVSNYRLNELDTDYKVTQSEVAVLKAKEQVTDLKLQTLSTNQVKFDNTIIMINQTLSELNSTLAGLKATVQSQQK
ncbi:hypothetical protein L4D00_14895 [Photobacterium swingsii]|uniref:hypothetical protein n=1 Tax=Photobacterium swingsii TaxID=680026 RepID=UPI003D097105